MKTYITLLFLSISFLGYSQKNNEKLKALKIAHITNEVNFTSGEAEKFWPIYNDFEAKRNELRKKDNAFHRKDIKATDLSEAEAKTYIATMIKREDEKIEHRKAFLKQIQKVLSAKKTLKFIEAERSFRHKMIKEYKGRMRPNGRR